MRTWTPSAAFYRGLAVAVFGVGTGLVLGRPDVVLLVAPILLAMALALAPQLEVMGRRAPISAVATVNEDLVSGRSVQVAVTARAPGAELVTVTLPQNTERPQEAIRTVAGGDVHQIDVLMDSRSWGPRVMARPDVLAATADGLLVVGPTRGEIVKELVLPVVQAIPPMTLPPISGGWAGAHVSRRPGQGNDLVDLRDYAPGDRMRSVHWRAYARLGKLYTRRTLSDADADFMICLDVRQNLGPRLPVPPITWSGRLAAKIALSVQLMKDRKSERRGGPGTRERLDREEVDRYSSLDHTVHAASAVAAAHLKVGDRVGIMSVNSMGRHLKPGTGTRHLQRIRYFLATFGASNSRLLPVAHWGLRPGTVVVLISPIADDRIVESAVDCAHRGHQVVVIDSLPLEGILRAARPTDVHGLRMLTLQRALRVETIRKAGIPVLCYEGGRMDVELAAVLRGLRGRR